MSRITLSGNASGTGNFTLASPNSNTDRTLTLPDATGTVNVSGLANEVPAGSAGAPAIYPTGDSNTGIFFPAADTIAFAEGGAEAMRINSSGNIGVGTSSPNAIVTSAPRKGAKPTSNSTAVGLSLFNDQDAVLGDGVQILFDHSFGTPGSQTRGAFVRSIGTTGFSGQVALAFGTSSGDTLAERARIDGNGNLLLGTTGEGSSRLTVNADGATNYTNAQAQLISNSGDVILSLHSAGASAVCIDHVRSSGSVRIVNLTRSAFAPIEASAFVVSSDYRIKENVEPMTGASARLAQIPVYRFNYVEGSMSYRGGETVDGFLAHEVQSVVPEAVTGEKDAVNEDGQPILQGIDQSKLVPLLTAALQEALTEIASMKARITALEAN
jgi:hypothetical protein